MKTMMKTYFAVVLVTVALAFGGNAYSSTIATFSDPAIGPSTPLFTVDTTAGIISGGWANTLNGLNLNFAGEATVFTNAFFTMSNLTILPAGNTGAGTIKFFAHGANSLTATPLLQISFSNAQFSAGGLNANNYFSADGVVFGGSQIGSDPLTQQVFSFSFANFAPLSSGHSGYTATAAFTSSAADAPEPATIALLSIGAITIFRKRSR